MLSGATVYSLTTDTNINPVLLIMGTAVFTGAALAPDLDSYTATATRSFGIFGRILYYLTNGISMLMYNITKTSKDDPKENGHRTFMHTIVAAILVGLGVLGLTSLPGQIPLFGQTLTGGQLAALIIMWFFLHLGISGLFGKQLRDAKKGIGAYILMLISFAITVIISIFLPTTENYQWLALLVTLGMLVHDAGDGVTKAGVPLMWPLKIRGKRWYDVALPAPLRIAAGGAVENAILIPIFIVTIAVSTVLLFLIGFGIL